MAKRLQYTTKFETITTLIVENGTAKMWDIIIALDDDSITISNIKNWKSCTKGKNINWNLFASMDGIWYLVKFEMNERLETTKLVQVSRMIQG